MRRGAALVLLVVAFAAPAFGQEAEERWVLPGFAWSLPGKAGSWSSELFVANPSGDQAQLYLVQPLVGRVRMPQHPCLPPAGPLAVLAAGGSAWVPSSRVSMQLGCPQEFVGALVLRANGPLVISSRMTSERQPNPTENRLLSGFGQEIPAVRMADLPAPGTTYLLAGLLWHPDPCGPPRYETAVHFANPGEEALEVTLEGVEGPVLVDGVVVSLPTTVSVRPLSWRQVKVERPISPVTICGGPEVFSLTFRTSAPVAVYASVVDRQSLDPRTVMPVPIGDGR